MAYDRQRVSITWKDSKNRTKSQRIFLRTTDAAQAEIDAIAVVAALRAVTDLGDEKWQVVSEKITETAPTAGSNVDEGVKLTANLSGNPDNGTFRFPGKDMDYVQSGGVIDLEDVNIAALQDLFDPATGVAYIERDQSVVEWIAGLLDK